MNKIIRKENDWNVTYCVECGEQTLDETTGRNEFGMYEPPMCSDCLIQSRAVEWEILHKRVEQLINSIAS